MAASTTAPCPHFRCAAVHRQACGPDRLLARAKPRSFLGRASARGSFFHIVQRHAVLRALGALPGWAGRCPGPARARRYIRGRGVSSVRNRRWALQYRPRPARPALPSGRSGACIRGFLVHREEGDGRAVSGDILAIMARSESESEESPGPKNSTNFSTTPFLRSIWVMVRVRSVGVVPSGSGRSA
jgi:hypothetical protein